MFVAEAQYWTWRFAFWQFGIILSIIQCKLYSYCFV